MNRPSESELHAYADGRLEHAREVQVRAWLQDNRDDASQVEAWQMQNQLLRNAYASFAAAPVPDRAADLLHTRSRLQWRPGVTSGLTATLPRVAAALCLIAIGWAAGFATQSYMRGAPADGISMLPRQAATAHVVYAPEVRHPVEVGVDQEAHLVQWLSKRLGGQLIVPDLHAVGYALVGGRLLPAQQGPAAQFMYEDQNGRRLTLYVRTSAGQHATAFRYAREGSVSVFYWIDGTYGYALSGDLERDALLRIAGLAYPQLGGR